MDLWSGVRPELVLCRSPAVRVCYIPQRHPLPRYVDSITHKVTVNIRGQYQPYISFPHLMAQPSRRVHKYPAGSKVITGCICFEKLQHLYRKTELLRTCRCVRAVKRGVLLERRTLNGFTL